jgi:hypothetical protein
MPARRINLVALLSLVLPTLVLPAVAQAFHHGAGAFEKPAKLGGAENVYYTGSPRGSGLGCDSCHVAGPKNLRLEFTSSPEDLERGFYHPNMLYQVTLRMHGETRGFDAEHNINTISLEIVDDEGSAQVEPWRDIADGFTLLDQGRVLNSKAKPLNRVEWSFWIKTPVSGAGPMTLYASGVDGDGAVATEQAVNILGDDTASLVQRFCEGAPGCGDRTIAAEQSSPVGCSTGGSKGRAPSFALLLFALVLNRRGRRRRSEK